MAADPENTPADYVWFRTDYHGKITYIDWDFCERLAELRFSGKRMDDVTGIAAVIISVREHVLAQKTPAIPGVR